VEWTEGASYFLQQLFVAYIMELYHHQIVFCNSESCIVAYHLVHDKYWCISLQHNGYLDICIGCKTIIHRF
jgi:hypothetical protein